MRLRWALPVALLLAAAAYAGYWFAGSHILGNTVDRWMADMERQGRPVTAEALEIGGFPTWFRLAADETSVVDRRLGTLTADRVAAEARPWRWSRIEAVAEGLDLGATPVNHPPIHATAERMTAVLGRDGEGRRTLDLDLTELIADEPGTAGANRLQIALAVPEGSGEEAAAGGALVLSGGLLPERMMRGLPVDLASADVQLAVDPWRRDLATPAGMAAWQQTDGRLTVGRLDIVWGPLSLEGSGELGLDDALRPEGTVRVRAAGWRAMLDEVEAAGLIESRQAQALRFGLAAFRQPGAEGESAPIEVELRLSEGRVFLGLIPLGRIPPLPDLIGWPTS